MIYGVQWCTDIRKKLRKCFVGRKRFAILAMQIYSDFFMVLCLVRKTERAGRLLSVSAFYADWVPL